MATGDVDIFNQAVGDLGDKIHNLSSDVWRIGLINNTGTYTLATLVAVAAPHWGGTGTTNLFTDQVGTTAGYTGPVDLTVTISDNWTYSTGTGTYDLDDLNLTQNGSGFTNAYWGVIYNDTDANKRALCAVEMGGPVSLQSGDVDIVWNASGVFTIA